jgi:3',5'-nucleoside bisphosphate phosphatase
MPVVMIWRTHLKRLQSIAICSLAVFCTIGGIFAQVRDPLPVPDVAPYKTLKCDFHLHTVFSDGEVWPATRVTEAWRDGLDAIALTDHAESHIHRPDVSVDVSRPFEIARAAAEQLGIILIPGVEIADGNLHANALFIKDPNVFAERPGLATALQRAHEQDAFVFWNHPGWKQTAEWFPPIAAAHSKQEIQGIELLNGSSYNKEAFPWIREKNLAIFANSDAHAPIAPDSERAVTLVFAKQADAEGIREALFARRTAAWMRGEIWGDETLLKGLWDGSVKLLSSRTAAKGRTRFAALVFQNQSAVPFRVRALKSPAWLRFRGGEIRKQKITSLTADIADDAPAGQHVIPMELELVNLHAGPSRNVRVTVSATIDLK